MGGMASAPSAPQRTSPGGRGARERILQAATALFYGQGINATGVEQLAAYAKVSKRTLYQHFASKDEIVQAYLRRFEDECLLATETALDRDDLSPRERLLATFDAFLQVGEQPARGCPYVGASVEFCSPGHPAHELAAAHKRAFRARLIATAQAAGAADPEALGWQLALLLDGAAAQLTVLNTSEPGVAARAAAAALIARAVGDLH
jgi:AcrR family transcriptional regulator